MTAGSTELSEFAPAKINLTLRIGCKRPDGYHELESLVVFAGIGDDLRFAPGANPGLTVQGETASDAGPVEGNLVLKAASALTAQIAGLRTGHFHLTKRLPVAAGIGGGSSDAAAALRLLARVNRLATDDARVTTAARATGADVPVCLDPRPRVMRGIGDILSSPLRLPELHAVLVNPGIAVPTAAVFAALADSRADGVSAVNDRASHLVEARGESKADALIEALASSANDLEAPAIALFPPVGETLAALRAQATCRLARMSGSGGTCFGLFSTADHAKIAAAEITRVHPRWWVRASRLGIA